MTVEVIELALEAKETPRQTKKLCRKIIRDYPNQSIDQLKGWLASATDSLSKDDNENTYAVYNWLKLLSYKESDYVSKAWADYANDLMKYYLDEDLVRLKI